MGQSGLEDLADSTKDVTADLLTQFVAVDLGGKLVIAGEGR